MFSITCSLCNTGFESESSRTETCPACNSPTHRVHFNCECCQDTGCLDCPAAPGRDDEHYQDEETPDSYEELPAEGEVIEAWRLTPKTRLDLSLRMAAKYTAWLAARQTRPCCCEDCIQLS